MKKNTASSLTVEGHSERTVDSYRGEDRLGEMLPYLLGHFAATSHIILPKMALLHKYLGGMYTPMIKLTGSEEEGGFISFGYCIDVVLTFYIVYLNCTTPNIT